METSCVEGLGESTCAYEVEVNMAVPLCESGAPRDASTLMQVVAAVGEEANLASAKFCGTYVSLRGQPDQVQYAQDLLEAALHES